MEISTHCLERMAEGHVGIWMRTQGPIFECEGIHCHQGLISIPKTRFHTS